MTKMTMEAYRAQIESKTPPSGPYKLFPWIRRVILRQAS